jgi:hypothetical protein
MPKWLKFLKGFIGFFPLLLESAGILCFIAYGLEPAEEPQNVRKIILLRILIYSSFTWDLSYGL